MTAVLLKSAALAALLLLLPRLLPLPWRQNLHRRVQLTAWLILAVSGAAALGRWLASV